MHPTIAQAYEVFQMYAALRAQLMATLEDGDLAFTPGGENPTLGALSVEMGEIEMAYIASFRTFRQHFDVRVDRPELAHSVSALQDWYAQLDNELLVALDALTDEQVENQLIERGPDFHLPPRIQLEVYKEALLIFYGKVMVYLKAMGKSRPDIWNAWIG